MRRRFNLRSYRAVLRLLRDCRNLSFRWTPAAFDALINVIIDIMVLSAVTGILTFAGNGILTRMGWPYAGRNFALVLGLLYLFLLLLLHFSYRALHAAGLMVSVDMIGNIWEYWRTGQVKIRKVKRIGPDKPQLHITFTDDIVLKFATLQFFLHWLWILVNCMLNATWFAVLVPWAFYPQLFLIALYAGVTWLISHEEFDFDWFRWFGTVMGVTGFSGSVLYMVLDYYKLHPYPYLVWMVTFVIGFTWATKHIKKATLPVAIVGGLMLVVTYLWQYFTFTISLPSFNITPQNVLYVIGGAVVLILVGVIVWGGVEFEEVKKSHGGHS